MMGDGLGGTDLPERKPHHVVANESRERAVSAPVAAIAQVGEIFYKGYCSTFVVIWQLVSNHNLIKLKKFVS